MKKFILPLILCLLASASCKKEDTYIDPILKEVEYTEYIPQAGLTFMIPFGYKSVTKAGTFFKGYRYRVIAGASIGATTLGTPIYSMTGKKYYQEITVPENNTPAVRNVTVDFALENGYTEEGGTYGAEGWGPWVTVFSTIQQGKTE